MAHDPYGYSDVVAAAALLRPHILAALETEDPNVGRVVFPSVPEERRGLPTAVVALNYPPPHMVHVYPPVITGRFEGGDRNPTVHVLGEALATVGVNIDDVIVLDRLHVTLPSRRGEHTDVTALLRELEQSAPQELQAFQDAQSRMRERILSHFPPAHGRRLPVLVCSLASREHYNAWFELYTQRTEIEVIQYHTVHPSSVFYPLSRERRRQSDAQLTRFGRVLGYGEEEPPSTFFENSNSQLGFGGRFETASQRQATSIHGFGGTQESDRQRRVSKVHGFGGTHENDRQRLARLRGRPAGSRNTRPWHHAVYQVERVGQQLRVIASYPSKSAAERATRLSLAGVTKAMKRGTHYARGYLWFYGPPDHRLGATASSVQGMEALLRRNIDSQRGEK